MKGSNIRKIFLCLGLCFPWPHTALAQNQWMESILPTDDLLENLPWLGDDGKVESRGLFDFEDVRGAGQKDLILIYRQSAPVSELDKPHDQTLVVCFYDSKQNKYVKNFQDEGGTIRWVKIVKDPAEPAPFLFFQRDDLKGSQVLKGFVYSAGTLKQVLDASAAQIYARLANGNKGLEIWGASKDFPKDEGSADHVFSWNGAQSRFAEAKPAAGGLAGWSGSSIAVPVVQTAAAPQTVAAVHHASKNGWWDDPMDPQAASAKLNKELVPDLIKKGQIATLGQKAKAFFAELQKQKVSGKDINGMRSGYYTAVATTLLDMGSKKDAAYYLKIALSFQADNPDAVALKAKLAP